MEFEEMTVVMEDPAWTDISQWKWKHYKAMICWARIEGLTRRQILKLIFMFWVSGKKVKWRKKHS